MQRLESGKCAEGGRLRGLARWYCRQSIRDGGDVIWRGAAATSGKIEKSALCELADACRQFFRRVVVFAELVRQTGVWVNTDRYIRDS